MKVLILIFLMVVFLSSNELKSDNKELIVVNHIGVTDKYLSPVVISTKNVDTASFYKSIQLYKNKPNSIPPYNLVVMENDKFLEVKNYIFPQKIKHTEEPFPAFGCFKVSYISQAKLLDSFYIVPKEPAYDFFTNAIEFFKIKKTNEQLISEFEYVLCRLKRECY